MLYLDVNFFIFAFLDRTDKCVEARNLQQRIVDGKERAIASSLTLDERYYLIAKIREQLEIRIMCSLVRG